MPAKLHTSFPAPRTLSGPRAVLALAALLPAAQAGFIIDIETRFLFSNAGIVSGGQSVVDEQDSFGGVALLGDSQSPLCHCS